MSTTLSIYEAKANFSKLIKKVQAGETIYVGAYGRPQIILAPLPKQTGIKLGVWDDKYEVDYAELAKSDREIARWLEGDDDPTG